MLLLDLGNTRLKAALRTPDGFRLLGQASHRDQGLAAALGAALGGTGLAGAGALCANVAGPAAGRALADALQSRGCAPVTFLRASAAACGVRCAYAEPARFGADRWAALLGARGLTDGACLVVDAGSALTIDAMAPGGRHLGGWIIPGLAMMVAALEARTGDLAGLRRASPPAAAAAFPSDTGPAIDEGARLAATGAVELARARLTAHCGAEPRLFLAGGDAGALGAALPGAELVPELVLLGLARVAA
jgi:type III pantothenate kinase